MDYFIWYFARQQLKNASHFISHEIVILWDFYSMKSCYTPTIHYVLFAQSSMYRPQSESVSALCNLLIRSTSFFVSVKTYSTIFSTTCKHLYSCYYWVSWTTVFQPKVKHKFVNLERGMMKTRPLKCTIGVFLIWVSAHFLTPPCVVKNKLCK